jgi:hypothetical protein
MDQKLRSSLERLQQQLHETPAADPPTQEHIEHLKGAIEQTLARPETSDHQGLGDRIRAAVLHFEQRHPALTSAADEVTAALAQVGI